MKKTLLLFGALLLLSTSVLAATFDQTVLVLYSGATGTTSPATGSVVYVPSPFVADSEGCDISTSPTTSVTVLFRGGNSYQRSETFDAAGLATATTCTLPVCNVQFTKTLRAMDTVITAASPTATVNVNCSWK